MYGLIIHSIDKKYVPCLREAIDVLGDIALGYNWLISDYECSIYPSTKIPFGGRFAWLTGSELVSILKEYQIQFIWGVATAYPKDIKHEEVLRYPLPFADGNTAFWKPEITIQNPLAKIEIVPWDSTLLLVIAKSYELVEKFANKYPNSDDLEEYNRS
ncbi:MAG: hypothetical protein FWC73_12920 [Defluviitaleaceae bacterium]|nr:hypothetical protein [Defluviitaleaceae bacterium]